MLRKNLIIIILVFIVLMICYWLLNKKFANLNPLGVPAYMEKPTKGPGSLSPLKRAALRPATY